ncbi:pilus assembly protein PilZ [Shewanella sp. NFH-SH190041]|uniref:PilZ domain-containing protein n=1 Tax=Shewanella sp. NFH-SH190041 TaxID=2950245 RepID=UPI0021C26097|nr:PilZ domain-containing protein [Shewanella sp. NFH-SH190041]BDM65486.1 pilus assembly protein PilZ [Shewanella sp. NFH-SH190041]
MRATLQNAIIEQLKPLLMEPDFEVAFNRLTATESNSDRFLIKMELNRLKSTCTRIIDLRDKSEFDCQTVTQGQQQHFLDAPAIEVFHRTLAIYGNLYTTGVYEAVMDSHQQRRQQQYTPSDNSSAPPSDTITHSAYPVPKIVLGSYFNRNETRLYYRLEVIVTQAGIPPVQGYSIDLSLNGAQIRLPADTQLQTALPVRLLLPKLKQEYLLDELNQGIEYRIISQQEVENEQLYSLQRLPGSDKLDTLLNNLINSYKIRYRADISDVLQTTTGLGLEQQYLPHMPHLPLFIGQDNQQPTVQFALLGQDNLTTLNYFLDETQCNQLSAMLSPDRLKQLIDCQTSDAQIMFSFCHQRQGQTFFYSATLTELKANGLLNRFLSYGASKPGWRIFKVNCNKIDHQQTYKVSVLPGEQSCYAPLIEQQLSQLSHVIHLTDITHSAANQLYRHRPSDGDANQLKIFGQPKLRRSMVKLIALPLADKRKDARVKQQAEISLTTETHNIEGWLHNISSQGVQLRLPHPASLSTGQQVEVRFTHDNLPTLNCNLVKLGRGGRIVHLSALTAHHSEDFITVMEKLKQQSPLPTLGNEHSALAEGLKNIMMRHLPGNIFFLEKQQGHIFISAIGSSPHGEQPAEIFKQPEEQRFELGPLLQDGLLSKAIMPVLRSMRPRYSQEYVEVFIRVSHQGHIQHCYTSQTLNNLKAQLAFWQQSQTCGQFIALRLAFAAARKPDLAPIQRELGYLSRQAAHKAKALQQRLWRIIAVGDITNITEEVNLRFGSLTATKQK